jgi:hypothetical protein
MGLTWVAISSGVIPCDDYQNQYSCQPGRLKAKNDGKILKIVCFQPVGFDGRFF